MPCLLPAWPTVLWREGRPGCPPPCQRRRRNDPGFATGWDAVILMSVADAEGALVLRGRWLPRARDFTSGPLRCPGLSRVAYLPPLSAPSPAWFLSHARRRNDMSAIGGLAAILFRLLDQQHSFHCTMYRSGPGLPGSEGSTQLRARVPVPAAEMKRFCGALGGDSAGSVGSGSSGSGSTGAVGALVSSSALSLSSAKLTRTVPVMAGPPVAGEFCSSVFASFAPDLSLPDLSPPPLPCWSWSADLPCRDPLATSSSVALTLYTPVRSSPSDPNGYVIKSRGIRLEDDAHSLPAAGTGGACDHCSGLIVDPEYLQLCRPVFFVPVGFCPEFHGVPVTLGQLDFSPLIIRVFVPVVSQETGVPEV